MHKKVLAFLAKNKRKLFSFLTVAGSSLVAVSAHAQAIDFSPTATTTATAQAVGEIVKPLANEGGALIVSFFQEFWILIIAFILLGTFLGFIIGRAKRFGG